MSYYGASFVAKIVLILLDAKMFLNILPINLNL